MLTAKTEPTETRLDSQSQQASSASQSAESPPPTVLPYERIEARHEHRTFVLERGAVLHIPVLADDGRSTFLTFEG